MANHWTEEIVFIATEDNIQLAGAVISPNEDITTQATIVWIHGNAASFYDRPYMLICRGQSVLLEPEEARRINDMTDPTWPHVHARLDCAYQAFLSVFPSNHILAVEGDRVRELVVACELAGIRPMLVGNAARERIVPVWERMSVSS